MHEYEPFSKAFISGAVAGTIAAVVTTPFDVAKTLMQIEPRKSSIEIMGRIVEKRGIQGLFAGLGARVAKITPACAIMISTYEIGKQYVDVA